MSRPSVATVYRPDPANPARLVASPADTLPDVFGHPGPTAVRPPAPAQTAQPEPAQVQAYAAPYRPSGPAPVRVRFDLGPLGMQQGVYASARPAHYAGPPVLLLAFAEDASGYLPPVVTPPAEPMGVAVDGHDQIYRVYNPGMVLSFMGYVLVPLPLVPQGPA